MIRFLRNIILPVLFLFALVSGQAKGFDFRVKSKNGTYLYFRLLSNTSRTVELTFNNKKTSGYEGYIEIPDTVKYKEVSYRVVAIGDSAFYNCYELNEVILPQSLQKIGHSSFDASRLRQINIPNSVTHIGDYAFRQCTQLQEVYLPEKLESIGKGVFIFCTNLREITLPEGLQEIGVSAFYGCSRLQNLTLPKSLRFIGENAFFDCMSLSELTTNSQRCNYTNNFSDNKHIIKITINPSVSSISEGAFANLEALTEVVYRSISCEYLSKKSIFEGCDNLYSISIDQSVRTIPNFFAKNCSGLRQVTIPTSIESIGSQAFAYCKNLEKLNFNAINCTYENRDAFLGDSLLNEVVIGSEVRSLPDGFLNGCVGVKNISLPKSVKIIGEKAFASCESLQNFTIDEHIEKIGKEAFTGCKSLEWVSCKAMSAPKTEGNLGWNENTKIYIPCEYIYYYNNSDFWKEQRFECDTSVAVASKSNIEQYDIITKMGDGEFCFKISSKSRRTISLVKFYTLGTVDEIVIPAFVAWEGGTYTVTSIQGNAVFEDVYAEMIDIPQYITSISSDAFFGIKSLSYINVDEANKVFSSENGVLYNKDKTTLICHPSSNSAIFTIPNSVVSLSSSAFSVVRDNNLKTIHIPASVIAIGDGAFAKCTGLKEINLAADNNAYLFEDGVLYDKKKTCIVAVCPAYFNSNEFTVAKNIKSILSGAFQPWERLKSVYIQAPTPPTISTESFHDFENIEFFVPKNALNKYKNAPIWKQSQNLKYSGQKTNNKTKK